MENELCRICNEKVNKFGAQAYGCELCPKWIHGSCVFPNASKSELGIFCKYNSGFDVKCCFCRQQAKRNFEQLVNEISDMKKQLVSNNEIISQVKLSLQKKSGKPLELPTEVEVIKSTYAEVAKKHNQSLLTEPNASSEKIIKQELEALEKRLTAEDKNLCNIIISGIPENESESLKSIVTNTFMLLEPKFEENDLLSCLRLGRPNLNENQNRLVLARLPLQCDAEYMHRYGKGRCLELKEVGKIWINPDLSKSESEALYLNRVKRRNKKNLGNGANNMKNKTVSHSLSSNQLQREYSSSSNDVGQLSPKNSKNL